MPGPKRVTKPKKPSNEAKSEQARKKKKNVQRSARNHKDEIKEEDEPVPDLMALDPEFTAISDDEPSNKHEKRYRRPKLNEWVKPVIDGFVQDHGEDIKNELQSETPNFEKIEKLFAMLNTNIMKANEQNNAPTDDNEVQAEAYRRNHEAWLAQVNLNHVKGKPEEEWKAYYTLHKMFRLFNKENHFPEEWNIPPTTAERMFGEKPSGVEELSDATDSAVSYSDESESEESDQELDGIDALEARMRREYSSLTHGKVLYWWHCGIGTQIFVRYGPKARPIYRVRAGSSLPYDPRGTEQVMSVTPGNAKTQSVVDGCKKEIYKRSRNDVQDIIGVGWKVEDDDDASANALALIRPVKDTHYPHTRVMVKWKRGGVSLERRGFVRRIANGSALSGDRMIYMKAKELENAYWGYDVENEETETELSDSDFSSSEESPDRGTRSKQRSKRAPSLTPSSNEESDADSETSSDDERAPRRSTRLARAKKTKTKTKSRSADKRANDTINRLVQEVKRLQIKQRDKERKKTRVRRNRHEK